jgi:deoxyribonuclease-1-like protein
MRKLAKTGIVMAIAGTCLAGYLCYSSYQTKMDSSKQPTSTLDLNETITSGSMNIQVFGERKLENTQVMDILVDIGSRVDILAVQELKGDGATILESYTGMLRKKTGHDYSFIISNPEGNSNNKEQYAFVFRRDIVEFQNLQYSFQDSLGSFERPPFIAKFKSGKFTYVLVNTHTKPSHAREEILALEAVVGEARHHTGEKDIIVEGDFNADMPYFSEKDIFGFRNPVEFSWLITDDMQTTRTGKTYDRIVITPSLLQDVASDGMVFNFDKEYNLTRKLAKKISDHFMVYAKFYKNRDTD